MESSAASTEPPVPRKKIVIIEDDPLLRKNLSFALENESFHVWQAEDGLEGLDFIEKIRPDLILCDVTMPRLDGFGLLQKIKSASETALTPFIFLSGKSEKSAIRQGMSLGADDYLIKPFTAAELINAIHSQLNKQHALHSRTQQKLLEKSHFVSSVMHDFRTPLAILLLSTELLEDNRGETSTQQRADLLADMRLQIIYMNRMLEDLLSLGKSECLASPLRCVDIELTGFCREIIREIRTIDRSAHVIDITTENPSLIVQTDDLLLRQIITNLLLNALKYTSPGKTISLRLRRDDEWFQIAIQDQGIGIPDDDQKNIFGPFQRGGNTDTIDGSGYGLYIVRSYLERIGGRLEVESRSGEGSLFTVQLPASPPS